ncbi:MAG: KOW motif-containing protein [bacterium]
MAEETLHWYAIKVYFNRVQQLIGECRELGLEFFAPADVIKSLLFLRCSEVEVTRFVTERWQHVWLYRRTESRQPAAIPDREMEVFRFVVTAGREGLTLLGDDRPEYHMGDRVVVTGGPFKGAEGHIKRIRRDRRLVVTIPGVVAVATAYIHPSLLQKVAQ